MSCTRQQPPLAPLVLDRLPSRVLNTILEEDIEPDSDFTIPRTTGPKCSLPAHQWPTSITSDAITSSEILVRQWLSPASDHFPTPKGFPTPRGIHFMLAPTLPSSPSATSQDDSDAETAWIQRANDRNLSAMNSFNPYAASTINGTPAASGYPGNNRDSVMTDLTEFDDLYDLSDDDSHSRRLSTRSVFTETRKLLAPLIIPASATAAPTIPPTSAQTAKILSPVAPIPTTAIAMSPAVIDFMALRQTQALLPVSATPSLDGSQTSEALAVLSLPPTPIIGNDDEAVTDTEWRGVQLQPGALETLHALSAGATAPATSNVLAVAADDLREHEAAPEQVIEIPEMDEEAVQTQMKQMRLTESPVEMISTSPAVSPSVPASGGVTATSSTSEPPPLPQQQQQQQQQQEEDDDDDDEDAQLIAASMREMSQPPLPSTLGSLRRTSHPTAATLSARSSWAALTALDIPSPGVFFSDLSPRSRRTWDSYFTIPNDATPATDDCAPPTSATAEQFYKAPWNREASSPRQAVAQRSSIPPVPPLPRVWGLPVAPRAAATVSTSTSTLRARTEQPVEHIVELQPSLHDDDDQPTARPVYAPSVTEDDVSEAEEDKAEEEVHMPEVEPTEIITDYNPDYARKQQLIALANLDRTETWLMAQNSYLNGAAGGQGGDLSPSTAAQVLGDMLSRISPASATTSMSPSSPPPPIPAKDTPPPRKTVRFSTLSTTTPSTIPCLLLPPRITSHTSAYHLAFLSYLLASRPQDAFVHRTTRFEALQAARVSLRATHRNALFGKMQLSVLPQTPQKRLSANVARADADLKEDPARLRREREAEAQRQMATGTWLVQAWKLLNGNSLFTKPVAIFLEGRRAKASRILDLGASSAAGDWAWHAALAYPMATVFSATTKTIRQLSNSNVGGPVNHQTVAVDRLSRLPFPPNHFDVVSARDLHSILKIRGNNGEDEWEATLAEVFRILKPGGMLDFSLLDADMINAGPLGLAKSVEFGFILKTLGYDAAPTKSWIPRLATAGFSDVRRTWLCLPVGSRPRPRPVLSLRIPKGVGKTAAMQAMVSKELVTGSTDNIGALCGMLGSWTWERWLLRCEMEKVASEMRLCDTTTTSNAMLEAERCLEGVAGIVEEGRNCRAAWRMLNGCARKPEAGQGTIQIQLA